MDGVQIKLGLHTGEGTFIEEGSNGFRLFLLFAKWLTDGTEALDVGFWITEVFLGRTV